MARPIDILLITGFLGSGKTTFLNALIEQFPRDRRIAILMNEFGEIGIDGTLVCGDGYELIEISRGSIFCICVKTDYIKAMHRLAHVLKPELLVVETTGVANPADMARDLQLDIFKGRFNLLDGVCIVDPTTILDLFDIYTSIEKQIAAARLFVINKMDLASGEMVERAKALILLHNPAARFFEARYGRLPIRDLWPVAWRTGAADRSGGEWAEDNGDLDLDGVLRQMFSDVSRELAPPDPLVSEVLVWNGSGTVDFSEMAADIPECVLRCKGIVRFGPAFRLFNYTLGRVSLDDLPHPMAKDDLVNRIVAIYPHRGAAAVDEFVKRHPVLVRVPGTRKDNMLIPIGTTI